MQKIITFSCILFITINVFSQVKPVIDTGMLNKWPKLFPYDHFVSMSTDGHYTAYVIKNQPIGKATLVVQNLRAKWKKSVVATNPQIIFFSADCRQLCWQQGDSLWLQTMDCDKNRLLGVNKMISYPPVKMRKWLLLLGNNKDSTVQLMNIVTGNQRIFKNIQSYNWSPDGKLLLLTNSNNNLKVINLNNGAESDFDTISDYKLAPGSNGILLVGRQTNAEMSIIIRWVPLNSGQAFTIWTGKANQRPSNFIFDKVGKQLVFTIQDNDQVPSVLYCKIGQSISAKKIDSLERGLQFSNIQAFSDNGRWLFIKLREPNVILPMQSGKVQVDIWSYRDEILYPAQTEHLDKHRLLTAAMDINNGNIQLIERNKDEQLAGLFSGDYCILFKGGSSGSRIGSWWPHSEPRSVWLVSLADGKRTLLKQTRGLQGGFECRFSPGGHWIYYWDVELGHYISVNPVTGEQVNMTEGLPLSLINDIEQVVEASPVGLVGWYSDDSALLVYDNFDIWKIDPSGKKKAVNITGGYGHKFGIKLRVIQKNQQTYHGKEELLLTGFSVESLYNGFFRIKLNSPGTPELLTFGPYHYYNPVITEQDFNSSLSPISGGQGENKCYLVLRQSADEYPNLYVSKNLKDFIALTDLQPQKAYNWLKSESISYHMYNGQVNRGVLYKPENFDSTQKYPVIFHYYEKYSHRCYQFPMPGLTIDDLNIPWFVSRGYLVFTPDIQFTVASKQGMTTGEAAYNAVGSAAEYLSQRSYIDKNRLGIQGHSFGGGETNNIITQTNVFAAAAEMAGYSDPVSAYLTLVTAVEKKGAIEWDHKIDHGNQRMGASPWERPDLYLRNSAVLNADKITTPLLITHNRIDGAVNFRQGIEMYMAMRRLGKRCWLLQYDNSGHSMHTPIDAVDHTVRLTQYFDHYLKGTPAPQWMTMNTLSAYKGKNNLYELDSIGNCSNYCSICRRWNKEHSGKKVDGIGAE